MLLIQISSASACHFDLVDDLRDSELVSNSYAHTANGLTRVSAVCSCVVAMDQFSANTCFDTCALAYVAVVNAFHDCRHSK